MTFLDWLGGDLEEAIDLEWLKGLKSWKIWRAEKGGNWGDETEEKNELGNEIITILCFS